MSDGVKIGQNVPVKTAEWIARIGMQYLDVIDNGVEADDMHKAPRFYDNTKKQEILY
jgi:hypothetical protein